MEQVLTQGVVSEPAAVKSSAPVAEFVVNRHDFLKELSELHKVVQRRTTIPVLANVLVQAKGNLLALSATDLEVSLRTVCPARVKQEGRLTVPAQKLHDYVRLLEDGEIAIRALDNGWVQIRSGRSHTKMAALSAESYPNLPLFPSDSAIKLESGVLRSLIGRTIFAISTEESRYLLNGALLVLKPKAITMIATDGHRLAHAESSSSLSSQETRIIVPKKALMELSALLNASNVESILFAHDQSTLFFAVGNRLLTSRQLTGKFPNYDAVMPKDPKGAAVVSKDDLLLSIQRVSQFSDERSNSVRIRLEKNVFKISSSNAETGESEDVVETDYAGEPAMTAFNARYLLDFLRAVESTKVRFEFKDAQSASELKPEDASDSIYRYVVMPVRV